ncbi:MAG: 6-phosphogluconolactonase [Myxococcales bacterium]|nr:6-phosphogluconolactonase [Myxococcales bacterium]
MTTKVVPGLLVAAPDQARVAREASGRMARAIEGAIARGGRASLALSGGNTPRETYSLLAREPGIDWSRVDVFQVDERAVGPTDDRSNFRMLKAALLDAAGVAPTQIHRMKAESPERQLVAGDYERAIRARVPSDADGVPSFDLLVLGIGPDGHTASLFPDEPTVDIVDRLVALVPAKPPREARMTLTAPVIEHARAVFIIAVGADKHDALERVWAVQGDLRETPARILRSCRGSVTWVIDQAAGGLTQ